MAKKKPLVFSMGELAASGGYWITCIGQPIFAEHGTITGSIGVFSMKFSGGALARRMGVHIESVTLDSAAGMNALNHAWTEEETEMMQKFIGTIYDKFLQIASASRNIPVETLKSLAGGRVWSGEQAKANRLVDQLGGLDEINTKSGIDPRPPAVWILEVCSGAVRRMPTFLPVPSFSRGSKASFAKCSKLKGFEGMLPGYCYDRSIFLVSSLRRRGHCLARNSRFASRVLRIEDSYSKERFRISSIFTGQLPWLENS
jgi:signal peptide peptidase SppA